MTAVTAIEENRTNICRIGIEARIRAPRDLPLFESLPELSREGLGRSQDARLDSMVSDAMRRSVRWPKTPNGLGSALRRTVANLRAAGVELQFSRNDVQGQARGLRGLS